MLTEIIIFIIGIITGQIALLIIIMMGAALQENKERWRKKWK